ncbi:hypothetical protein EYF80_062447 [Liparis tanakae]|uniref:Uncharacterized protein n=1 Tax=Liparis tanakae TaxID=230148 RepID=A0A4Z2EF93_9TELE|nr:hypothetical protein EYF80_062447 [Liparis tanakae]
MDHRKSCCSSACTSWVISSKVSWITCSLSDGVNVVLRRTAGLEKQHEKDEKVSERRREEPDLLESFHGGGEADRGAGGAGGAWPALTSAAGSRGGVACSYLGCGEPGGRGLLLPRLRGVGGARLLRRRRGLRDQTALLRQLGEQEPDDVEDAAEVGLDLADGLRQQAAVGAHAHVGHPVDRHQRLHQAAQRVQRRVARLQEAEEEEEEESGHETPSHPHGRW